MSPCSQPIGFRNATTLWGMNVPVDLLGAAEAIVILDNCSLTTSTGNVLAWVALISKKKKNRSESSAAPFHQ